MFDTNVNLGHICVRKMFLYVATFLFQGNLLKLLSLVTMLWILHKIHLVRARKATWFGLKFLFLSLQLLMEMV